MRNDSGMPARREMSVRDVHFNCPVDLNRQMRVYAALNDTTVTAVIITAVKEYLEREAPELRDKFT